MIQLPNTPLPTRADRQLQRWQQGIDALASYPERVQEAKKQFGARNTKQNSTFETVKQTLVTMCSGARRCAYCEDSWADEVEHFRPKDLYPEEVFAWVNYLYSCGPCNSPKGGQFKVFSTQTGAAVDVTRARGAAVVPPVGGRPVLINPRFENPLEFMDLDVLGTFRFVERDDTPEIEERARYTIELLHLNSRDALIDARRKAFLSYRAHLYEYLDKKRNNATAAELQALSDAIRRMHHPTVWKEMQRKHSLIPELQTLFGQVPEALAW
jgi:uncharacterized protein (TIGR02646 family)